MSVARSNSSQAQRMSLKRHFVIIPAVNPRVDVGRYIFYAKGVYEDALSNYKRNNIVSAFIELEKFFTLVVDRIPTHPNHRNPQHDRKLEEQLQWMKGTMVSAVDLLEDVVCKMDLEQDRLQQRELEYRLIDEFDSDEPAQPTAPDGDDYANPYAANYLSTPTIQSDGQFGVYRPSITRAGSQDEPSPSVLADLAVLPPSAPLLSELSTASTAGSSDSTASTAATTAESSSSRFSAFSALEPFSTPTVTLPVAPAPVPVPAPIISSAPTVRISPKAVFTPEDIAIVQHFARNPAFSIPPPATSLVDINLGNGTVLQFYRDDFHTSFAGFLSSISADLQFSQAALEANRCFFIHLAIAIGVHPFILQFAFRMFAHEAMKAPDCWYEDLLTSVLGRSGFVDANALCFLWPQEMNNFRLLFVSNPANRPIFSHFSVGTPGAKEVVILCEREHFTLLRPCTSHPGHPIQVIDNMLAQGKAAGLLVQENEVQQDRNRSVQRVINSVW